MKKVSAFKSCIKVSLDRSKFIFILYFIYSFLCIILGILLSLSLTNESFSSINSVMSQIYAILSNVEIIGLALGLVSVIWLFGKYTNYCSNNLIKSLPAKDKHLFWADFIVGLLAFLIPVTISLVLQTYAGSFIEAYNTTQNGVYSAVGVSYGFILNYIFGYCIGVLCFSVSSGVFEGIITFAVLNYVPSIVSSIVLFGKSSVLGLYQVDEYANKLNLKATYSIIKNSVTGAKADSITSAQMIRICAIIVVICIIVVALAFFAFIKLRLPDKVSSKFKKTISTIALCILSFYCGFLVLFFKRSEINSFNTLIVIPTMLAVSFIVFYIANTIIKKSIHISAKTFVPYLGIFVFLSITGSFYFTGGYGAACYIPKADAVKSVTINYCDSRYEKIKKSMIQNRFTYGKFLATYDLDIKFPITYTDEESIDSVLSYHNKLLSEYESNGLIETVLQGNKSFTDYVSKGYVQVDSSDNEDGSDYSTKTIITYTLKSGKKVTRYYNYNGDAQTLDEISTLLQFDNSAKKIASRAQDYLKKEPNNEITHTLYIGPIFTDDAFTPYSITDSQLQKLVYAVYLDEKDLTADEIMSSKGGDICYISVVPTDEEGYFSGVFNNGTDSGGYKLVVKSCYKYTKMFLDEILNGQELNASDIKSIKQIIVGRYGSDFYSPNQRGRFQWPIYQYEIGSVYSYTYFSTTRYYNTDALKGNEQSLVDGSTCNNAALKYLTSKFKLFSTIDSEKPGYIILANSTIDKPFDKNDFSEEHMVLGKRLYYVTADEYEEFIRLSNAS